MTRIAINGFGRIGRLVARIALKRADVEVVAVNDLGDLATSAHLFKYDSIHGIWPGEVVEGDKDLVIDGRRIRYCSEARPEKLPWGDMGADVIIEATGRFTSGKDARAHLQGGARKVVITAPGKEVDATLVMGVNEETYDPARHDIVSNASCTTNCLAPVVKVIHRSFGIERGLMTTIHSVTNDQRILDLAHKDLRRARAAGMSMVPTTTGAAKAIGLVMPELKGKLNGMAVRVPTPNVSLVDLVAELRQPATVEEINGALKDAASSEMRGILGYCDEPLVSRDFNGDSRSSIVDAMSTMVSGTMAKVVAWYDNEWGYSNRVVDLVTHIGKYL